ncbi:MAG: M20/M25/M40 family metallo-hydrolase [Promethearchaeota archaeon]|nr:MAG: M20/M25/M40 family metallo-hydrolase [Candidatus Lokiarchaeota archaeon]
MISKESLDKNLKDISFPRLSGTEHEKRASEMLIDKIKDLGITPQVQPFTFSTFYSRIYPKIIFTLAFWILFVVFLNLGALFLFINLLLFLIFFILLEIPTRTPETIQFGNVLPSQNVYVRIPSHDPSPYKKSILLFAHIDSKGQRLPIRLRILSFRLWIPSYGIGLSLIIFTRYIIEDPSPIFFILCIIFLVINLIATLLIDFNTTNNESYGAIDNCSGLVTVFELLKYYIENNLNLNHYELWFVFTGAEECGTMGVRNFYKKVLDINKEESYIINFDTIGTELGYFSCHITPNADNSLYSEFKTIFEKLDMTYYFTKATFGIRSDGLYLRKQGFHGFGFGDLDAYKYVHSVEDNVDKVNIDGLYKLCKFMVESLQKIDQRG